MKNIRSANSQIFSHIVAVSKQKEHEFNNGQDGAVILSLLVMFFTPFLLLNELRKLLHIDYSLVSIVGILAISVALAAMLYKTFKIGRKFANKKTVLGNLLSMYIPNNKNEFENLKIESKNNPANFLEQVSEWVQIEKATYSK
ncbi:hypothetical protein [Providencia stuartii]|uniref:hypothetical protein n=1 Tax=Providencia stuartii TaxID=588 RepID=UPI0018C52948|nr:hypothetical protein [Providencia stuartii]MBG5920617.1 hypothetical protein [Providencia stuartii]